jgi:CrcB protein
MLVTPRNLVAVFVGGALGTALRWLVGEGVSLLGANTVVALLLVNVVGSFILGWFVIGDTSKVHHINALFAVGLLGSFTTFSGYAVATVDLFQIGSAITGLMLAFGSVAVGLFAAVAGRLMGERT